MNQNKQTWTDEKKTNKHRNTAGKQTQAPSTATTNVQIENLTKQLKEEQKLSKKYKDELDKEKALVKKRGEREREKGR